MEILAIFVLAGLACAAAQTECVPETQEQKDYREVLNALDAFAINLYQELRIVEEGNLVVCPLSAAVVLALTWTGARGRSAQQLGDALHLQLNRERVADGFGALLAALPTSANQSEGDALLQLANALYVQWGFPIKEDFRETAVESFRAEVEEIDFSDSVNASNYINQWVADNTNDRIQNLISPDVITEDTKLILVNTVYFSAMWVHQFSESEIRNQTFHLSENEQVDIPMMHGTFQLGYSELSEFNATALSLPYQSDGNTQAYMVILLPNSVTGLEALEKNLGQLDITSIQFQIRRVEVCLPSFTIETSSSIKKILQQLGVTDIFGSEADLSGISSEPLKVSEVVQKAYIRVDANGTEAAAATAVIGSAITSVQVPQQTIEFNANHPFDYVLVVNKTINFIGRLADPSE